jgi:hypothetical protein
MEDMGRFCWHPLDTQRVCSGRPMQPLVCALSRKIAWMPRQAGRGGKRGSVANRSWRRTGTHRPISLGGEGIEHLGRRRLLARPDFHVPLRQGSGTDQLGGEVMTSRYSHGGYGWNQQLRYAVTLLHTALLSYGLSYGRLPTTRLLNSKSRTPRTMRGKCGGPNGI